MSDSEKVNTIEKLAEEGIESNELSINHFGYAAGYTSNGSVCNFSWGDFNKVVSTQIYDFLNKFDYFKIHKDDKIFDNHRKEQLKSEVEIYISFFEDLREKINEGDKK